MKRHILILSAITCLSIPIVTPGFGEQPAALPDATAPNQPQNGVADQEAKEKAEDDALLQQIDGGQPSRDTKPTPKKLWSPGGSSKTGVFMKDQGMVTHDFMVGQNLLGRPVRPPKAVLVRTSSPDPKSQTALEEDLAVMAHILNKAIDELPGGQTHPANALGVDLFFSPGGAPMRTLYLDHYGAVFFLNVGFPLIAPPQKTEEEKPGADSAWEDAKQELYGPRGPGTVAGEPIEEYSQEKVDKLKDSLLNALKNASNIGELKSDESVTLWVSGGAGGRMGRSRNTNRNAPRGQAGNKMSIDQSPSRGTILTIHVSRADIDSYATGKLDRAQFAKRAHITTYPGDSTGGGTDGFSYMIGRNRF
jgi:hypothetical protein